MTLDLHNHTIILEYLLTFLAGNNSDRGTTLVQSNNYTYSFCKTGKLKVKLTLSDFF